jgi:hypothetical protein
MHANWPAGHAPSDDFLNGPGESDLVGRVINRAKALSNVGFGRRLGAEWNSQDHKQQASQ